MDELSAQSSSLETQTEEPAGDGPQTGLENMPFVHAQRSRPRLDAALRSDIGSVRERNEDSALLYSFDSAGRSPLAAFGLYVVADGMGGYEGGDRASKIASRIAAQHLLQKIYLPLLNEEIEMNPALIEGIMRDAVLAAHDAIRSPGYSGNGGTTLTIALLLGYQLYLAHVGDSRAYWLVDGQLQAITQDHSLVQRLQDAGRLSAEEAENFQYRNILLRALGQEEELEVDIYAYAVPPQGKLLLCSDGLCGQVSEQTITQIMDQQLLPAQVADRLVEAAIEAGGWDNITAVVVEFGS